MLATYEAIKARTRGKPLTDTELYHELEHELNMAINNNSAGLGEIGITATGGTETEAGDTVLLPPGDVRSQVSLEGDMGMLAVGDGQLPGGPQPTPVRQTSILVVDDSHISCKLATRALGQRNFHVEVL